MVVENKKRIMAVRKRKFLFAVLMVTVVVFIAYLEVFDNAILGLTRYAFIGISIGLYLAYYFWGTIRGYNYWYYNDLGSKIVVRYYSLAPLSKRHHAVEIDKHLFLTYKLDKKLFGLQRHLILFQKTSGTIAKYPSISMGLLNLRERQQIIKSLELFKKLT